MDAEEQEDEQLALLSIFGPEEFVRKSKFSGESRVCVELPAGFTVALKEGETLRQDEISFLPALCLTFDLPEDYPSSSPPSFSLSCSWLTPAQLSALGAQLIELYQAGRGSVVLFIWTQFLQEDALRVLGIHNVLELPSEGDHSAQQCSLNAASLPENNVASSNDQAGQNGPKELDEDQSGAASLPQSPPKDKRRAPSGLSLTPAQTLLSQILIHDATQRHKAFSSTVFDCAVCFVGSLGSDCVRLPDCGHVFCRACLSEFCRLRITEGNVGGVTCPEADCAASPTPDQVKNLVGEELFSRYDRLLLQKTLDCMSDVVYCPRPSCGSAVIREQSSSVALCPACRFAFCVSCRKTNHGAAPCQARKKPRGQGPDGADVADVDLPQSQKGLEALWDDYATASKQRKSLLESRYGRHKLLGTVEECLSEDWIEQHSKYCPHCFCRIEKNMGCNRMTCSRCSRAFCWICLARLDSRHGAAHFQNNGCQIFHLNDYT